MTLRTIIIILLLYLSGCSIVPRSAHTAPVAPIYSNYCRGGICDDIRYANDLNWYMIYIYAYTKSYNEYAISQGWKPNADMRPVCRLVEWPTIDPFPTFDPNKYDSGINDFDWKLAQYIKQIRSIYNKHRDHLTHLSYIQRKMCTY